jgi:hypothetical protein
MSNTMTLVALYITSDFGPTADSRQVFGGSF